MNLLSAFLQGGAFIIIPVITVGLGIWKISKMNEKYFRLSYSGLIGFIFFETTIIGILIDPRSTSISLKELIFTSVTIGILVFLFVFLFLPLGMSILRWLKRL